MNWREELDNIKVVFGLAGWGLFLLFWAALIVRCGWEFGGVAYQLM